MPANLPPQYFETEKKLKTAKTPREKIAVLEELLAIVPKHKGTEKLQALLKTKIAKLRALGDKKHVVARHGPGFQVERSGAGQIILVGTPNSGKSSLIKVLTNAEPEIGDYPFTTRIPAPAMMPFENIQIQLVDTPPITEDYMEFWHAEMIKAADGLLMVLDLSLPEPAEPYLVLVEKLRERRIAIVPPGASPPAETGLFPKSTLVAANKSDSPRAGEGLESLREWTGAALPLLPVSARRGDNLEELRRSLFSLLDVVRVYSKIPGKKAETNEPFIFKRGSTLMDMAKAVHKDFARNLKYARLWGKTKFQGQKVNRSYVLEDEDIIELHI